MSSKSTMKQVLRPARQQRRSNRPEKVEANTVAVEANTVEAAEANTVGANTVGANKVVANRVNKRTPKLLKKAPRGLNTRYRVFEGLSTLEPNRDPTLEREGGFFRKGQQRLNAEFTAPPPAEPSLAIQAPLAHFLYERNDMHAGGFYPIQSDARNGPAQLMWDVAQAKIKSLEGELLMLRRANDEMQQSNNALVQELKKVADLVHVALGANVERGMAYQ